MLPALSATPALSSYFSRHYGAERLAGAIITLAWTGDEKAFRYLMSLIPAYYV